MFDKEQKIFTTTLIANTLTILAEYGVTAVAMKLVSGTGSYVGNKNLGAIGSTPNDLAVGESVTITAEQSKYIDGLLIDGSAGRIEVIAR